MKFPKQTVKENRKLMLPIIKKVFLDYVNLGSPWNVSENEYEESRFSKPIEYINYENEPQTYIVDHEADLYTKRFVSHEKLTNVHHGHY